MEDTATSQRDVNREAAVTRGPVGALLRAIDGSLTGS